MDKPVKRQPPTADDDGDAMPSERVIIARPRMRTMDNIFAWCYALRVKRLSQEAQLQMADKQKKGSQTQKGSKRQPKDFDRLYDGSLHVSTEGWYGHPGIDVPSGHDRCLPHRWLQDNSRQDGAVYYKQTDTTRPTGDHW